MHRKACYLSIALLVLAMPLAFPPLDSMKMNHPQDENNYESMDNAFESNPTDSLSLSDDSKQGILDPLLVEQQGYTSSGNLSARTDTGFNTATTLAIDEAHDWVGSLAEVDIWNLTQIYAVNGTFDDGLPGINEYPNGTNDYYPIGWSSNHTHNPDAKDTTTQTSSYVDAIQEYVVVENQGRLDTPSYPPGYTHFVGTEIVWFQEIQRKATQENFILSFDYQLFRGPLGIQAADNCSISVFINSAVVWNTTLSSISSRGEWYSVVNISINVTGGNTAFNFSIGFTIDKTITLNPVSDGGFENTATITIYFDNVLLVGETSPEFADVELQFTAGDATVPITGSSGDGYASILNVSYWDTDPLVAQIISNDTVTFEYNARLQTHRFTNSSWTTDISEEGAQYSVNYGESPFVELYTYIGFLGDYENLTTIITFPDDWENVTVYDPFLADVTGQCSFVNNALEIGEDLLDRLGWWKLTIDSPNYAKSINVQKYNDGTGLWSNALIFRSENITRTALTIGTIATTVGSLDLVNITWSYPNSTIWSQESLSGGIDGALNSSQRTLGGLNTSAGEWSVTVEWVNGTEVAYDQTAFEIHHRTSLTPVISFIQTDSGDTVTALVRFQDDENNEYLMDASSSIVGNWSGSTVTFSANIVNNWWQGDLDTSLVGAGNYTIIVNATRPYYDDINCSIIVEATSAGTILTADETSAEVDLGENFTIGLFYEDSLGTGIEGAEITVTASGPDGGLSNSTTDETSGDYTVTIDTQDYRLVVYYENVTGTGLTGASVSIDDVSPSSGLDIGTGIFIDESGGNYSINLSSTVSGTYIILIKANLTNHRTQFVTFTLTVDELDSTLISVNGTIDSVTIGQEYLFVVEYENATGYGLVGADVIVYDVSPAVGLDFGTGIFFDELEGLYSIQITPLITGTYVVRIQANLTSYKTQFVTFTITTIEIDTSLLVLNGSADVIIYGADYNLVLSFENATGYGLVGATVLVDDVSPYVGLGIIGEVLFDELDGKYSITLTPAISGTYTILFQANLTNHKTQFISFIITMTDITTILTLELSEEVITLEQNCTITLHLVNEAFTGIEGASFLWINEQDGLDVVDFVEIGSGNYTLTIVPNQLGSYQIFLRSYLANHVNSTSGLTISVVLVPTHIRIANNLHSDEIEIFEHYTLEFFYERLDFVGIAYSNITQATIDVDFGGSENLSWYITSDSFVYQLHIHSSHVGVYEFIIIANRTDFTTASISFILEIKSINTNLNEQIIDDLYVGRTHILNYTFEFTSNGTGISGADVIFQGNIIEWFSTVDNEDGTYTILLTPEVLGAGFLINIEFRFDGFQTQTSTLEFNVIRTPIEIDVSLIEWKQGLDLLLSISFIESESENPVSDLQVEYAFYHGTVL